MGQFPTEKYWISWWTKEEPENVPFGYHISGSNGAGEVSCCAAFEVDIEEAAWRLIKHFFPDFTPRFATLRPDDWNPGGPVPGGNRFEGATIYKVTYPEALRMIHELEKAKEVSSSEP